MWYSIQLSWLIALESHPPFICLIPSKSKLFSLVSHRRARPAAFIYVLTVAWPLFCFCFFSWVFMGYLSHSLPFLLSDCNSPLLWLCSTANLPSHPPRVGNVVWESEKNQSERKEMKGEVAPLSLSCYKAGHSSSAGLISKEAMLVCLVVMEIFCLLRCYCRKSIEKRTLVSR